LPSRFIILTLGRLECQEVATPDPRGVIQIL
jgi:hypothetical protein